MTNSGKSWYDRSIWPWQLPPKQRTAYLIGGLVLVVSFSLLSSLWEAIWFPLRIPQSLTWVGELISGLVAALLAVAAEVLIVKHYR